MITTDQTQQFLSSGGNVIDNDGHKIGSIGQVYLDDQSAQPEWVTVKTGLFVGGESFVPLRGAEVTGDDLRVPYSKDKVKDAPRIEDAESHLSETEEAELYSYYGVDGADHGTSGPNTDSAMTRSEEQLQVGTETREAGRASEEHDIVLTEERVVVNKETVPVERVRVDKETVTEHQQVSEEVQKEQIEFEGDSIDSDHSSDNLSDNRGTDSRNV